MPNTLSAADFTSVRMQYKTEIAPGEIPAAIEHTFSQGTMIDHYFVVVAPAILADADIAALGTVSGLLIIQQPENAPWLVYFHEITMLHEVCMELPDAEFRRLLQTNNIVLPGENT